MIIINGHCFTFEEWADALLAGTLCFISSGVPHGSLILVQVNRGILPVTYVTFGSQR